MRPIELFMQLRRHQIIYCLPNDVDHLLCLVIHTWRATSCDQIYCLIELSLLRLWSLLLRIVLREIHILLAQSDFGFYWRANYLSIFNCNALLGTIWAYFIGEATNTDFALFPLWLSLCQGIQSHKRLRSLCPLVSGLSHGFFFWIYLYLLQWLRGGRPLLLRQHWL